MQNPNPTNFGLPGAPPHGSYGSAFANPGGGMNGSMGQDGEGDLPTSLPSYMPPQQHTQQPHMPFGFGMPSMGQNKPDELQAQFATASISGGSDGSMQGSSKRQAPIGQWKTPPHFLYTANPGAAAANAQPSIRHPAATKTNRQRDTSTGQPSPSTGLRTMSFQDSPAPGSGSSDTEKRPPPPSEIAGISAAQFAASTGGLTMDPALLARVSGTDPSLIGSEEIKQIMRTPDLLSIYQKLQEEDDRRQRRLERNRASARVRREKKKNMVDTYEGDVSKLENALNLLKAHSFGTGQAQDLINALEYTGGESLRHAMMSKEAKTELMGRILGQQARNTTAIRNANYENQVLVAAACENSDLFKNLRTQLRLSDEQCRQLQGLVHHTREEARKLDAIAKCFSALRVHDWLYFPGIESLLQQTRNTMTPQQFQRFLTWTTDNREVLEMLQVTQAAAPDSEKDLEFMFVED